ncbi:MAG: heparinase II/III family protein [Clostridia bacterium]|nr:heparinase II/III family protein [Clostridia bacterium]
MRRYSMTELLEALQAEPNMPQALYMDSEAIAKKRVAEDPDYAWVVPYLKEKIEEYKNTPIEQATFQEYANFDRVGERHLSDRKMYALRERLNRLSIAVLLDIEGAVPLYEDILYEFLHLPTWSLTAHLLDHSMEDYWDIPLGPYDETGRIRGLGRTRKQSQDLCSNTAAFMLAEMAQLLEGKIEPCLIRWSRQEVYERVLSNFMSLSPFLYYETLATNWSGVCLSSIGCAAIYLITDPKTLVPVLMRCIEALRVHESGYIDDGFCPESFGYWQYGFEHFVMFADLLYRRTGGRIDLMEDEKWRKVAEFGTNCCVGKTMKMPFGDCGWRGQYDEALRSYIGGTLGIVVPPQGDTKKSFINAFEHAPMQLRHLVWTQKPERTTDEFPRSVTYPQAMCYIGSYRTKEDPVYLLVKGGDNGESHNHNDVGSFVIIAGDDMVAADTAGGDYNRDYFREKRYTFFATRSISHNVPIVDGTEEFPGGECRPKAFQKTEEGEEDHIFFDLTGVLPTPKLTLFHRRFTGNRATGHIAVEDLFELSEACEIRDRVISIDRPEVIGKGAIRINGAAGMTLFFDEEELTADIQSVAHKVAGRDCVYTIDLIPRVQKPGQTVIRMDWER